MERIVATITPGDTGSPVVKLQDALLALLDRQVIRALDALNLPTLEDLKRLTEDLRRERAASSFGAATVQLLMYFQIQEGLGDNLGGVVEEQTAAKLNEHLNAIGVLNNPEPAAFRVYGTLTGADGHPLPGATIVAVDVDLRRSEVLGQTKTDSKGDYEVRYTASQFTRAEKARADLVVRALLGDEKVAESKILFNATPEARIDLSSTNSYGPSEFEQLDRELAPLLDGTSPSDLMDSDVAFLAGETGRDIEQWRMFVQAQHSRVAHDQIPCEAFYGWFRLGQPTEWETLTSRPPSTLRQALQTALQRRLVPQGLADRIDEIIHALPNSAREQLQGLGSAIQLPKAALDRLTRHADSIDTIDDQILDRMVSGGELEHRHAQAIGLNLSLQRLAGGESSSIAATLQNTLPSHEPLQAARDLARLDVKDWEEGLEKATVPLPGGMTRGDQARAIVHEVAAAFPREVFEAQATRIPRNLNVHLERLKPLIDRDRGILGRALQEGDLRGIDAQGQEALREAHDTVRRLTRRHPGLQLHDVLSKSPDLGKAAVAVEERIGWMRKTFEMNPDIDFLRINFLPDSPDVGRLKFEGLSEAARDMVVANIKSTQRIQALAGNVAQTGLLMQAGYSSAASVARTSVRELVANVGLSESDAVVYQAEARGIANDAALMWMGLHAVAAKAATPAVLPPTDNGFFEKLPGYAALFGSADSCQCRDCQSVLSPAAYFVDLMHYIEEYILKPSFGLADPPTDKLHLCCRAGLMMAIKAG